MISRICNVTTFPTEEGIERRKTTKSPQGQTSLITKRTRQLDWNGELDTCLGVRALRAAAVCVGGSGKAGSAEKGSKEIQVNSIVVDRTKQQRSNDLIFPLVQLFHAG